MRAETNYFYSRTQLLIEYINKKWGLLFYCNQQYICMAFDNIHYCMLVSVFRLFIWAFLLPVWSLKYPKGVRMKFFINKVFISLAIGWHHSEI